MNFIELVRRVKLESGRLTAGPASIASAQGRDLMIANWVQAAWKQIQEMPRNWAWKRKTASARPLQIGVGAYAPADLSITDFGEWRADERSAYRPRVFPPGQPGAYTLLSWMAYDLFQATFLRDDQRPGIPQYWSVAPGGGLLLGPVPDRDLVLTADYFSGTQELTADTDVPAMPSRHHMVIAWRALQQVAMFDAAPELVQRAAMNYATELDDLVDKQAEPMKVMGR